jgi:hypothetical protein
MRNNSLRSYPRFSRCVAKQKDLDLTNADKDSIQTVEQAEQTFTSYVLTAIVFILCRGKHCKRENSSKVFKDKALSNIVRPK